MNASIVPSLALLLVSCFIMIYIVEPSTRFYPITVSSVLHPVTEKLVDTAHLQGQSLEILGLGKDRAERRAVSYIRAFLQKPDLQDHDIVLYTAAKDSAFVKSYDEIRRAYKSLHSPIVICALGRQSVPQSGCWIGRVWALRHVFASSVAQESEQDLWERAVVQFPGVISVDTQSQLFLHMKGIDRKQTQFDRFSRIFSVKKTDIRPMVLNTVGADRTLLQTVVMRWRDEE